MRREIVGPSACRPHRKDFRESFPIADGKPVPYSRGMVNVCSAHESRVFIDEVRNRIARETAEERLAELDTALEELRIAEESLAEQAEALGKALERSEADRRRYIALFEFAPDGYCVTNQSGVIFEANRAMCELLREPLDHLIGKPLIIFVHHTDRENFRRFIAKPREDASNRSHQYPLVWQTELQVGRNDSIPVSVRCTVRRDESADGSRLLWLFRDITEQRRVQQDLETSRSQLQLAVKEKTSELRERLEELESFHDVAVDRELRLMELEKKVNQSKGGTDNLGGQTKIHDRKPGYESRLVLTTLSLKGVSCPAWKRKSWTSSEPATF